MRCRVRPEDETSNAKLAVCRYERPTSKAQHNGLPSKGSIMLGVAYAAARANCTSSLAVITFSAVHNGVTERPPARNVRLNAHVEASAPPCGWRPSGRRRWAGDGEVLRTEVLTLGTWVRQSRGNIYSGCGWWVVGSGCSVMGGGCSVMGGITHHLPPITRFIFASCGRDCGRSRVCARAL